MRDTAASDSWITCSVIGTISGVFSAAGRNRPGLSRPRIGCSQRISASTPIIRPVRHVDLGLEVDTQLAAVDPVPQLAHQDRAFHRVLGQRGVVDHVPAAVLLRRVERLVDLADQGVGIGVAAAGPSRRRRWPPR